MDMTMLRKAMGIAGGLLLGGAALAQSPDPVSTGWRPVLGAGLTVGGDTVAKFQMNDGSTKTLSGGGFVHLYGGVHRQFGLWAVQATFGYQVDDVVAQNGSAKFERYPLEVLAQYQATEAIAVGAGLRHVSGAKYSSSGAAASQSAISSASLSVATSPFLEGDYAFSAKAHFSVKLVSETYKDPWGGSFKGDHIGFYLKGIL